MAIGKESIRRAASANSTTKEETKELLVNQDQAVKVEKEVKEVKEVKKKQQK
ncbi:MAG: hypothetical protein ACERKZ_08610 [Lachnotalea sp.]